jgi:hypothetical protein
MLSYTRAVSHYALPRARPKPIIVTQREICGDSPQLVFLLPMRALASEAVWLVNAFIHGGISDSSRNIWPIADEKVPTWQARLPRWCSRWPMVVSSTLAASYR